MTPNRPPWYKRKYISDSSAQIRVVLFLASIATVAAVCICWIAYERLADLSVLFNQRHVPPVALPQVFEKYASKMMFDLVSVVVVMIVIFSVAGIILTHRLAGPIWKVQREIKKVLKGEKIKPISFRKGDEFQELPPLVNQLIENYKPE